MTIIEAKEKVILAGKELVKTGLIARTWGNVSCRISDTDFVITPSGRDYMSLTCDDIVQVAISDLSYSGDVKPSSEKGVHAEVYKHNSNANFVIHTHQKIASSISASSLSSIKVPKETFPLMGGEVLCASYALPGTKKLKRSVSDSLARSKGNAVIMKHHGALCFGSSYEETFKAAHELEEACKTFIASASKKDNIPVDCPIDTLYASERGENKSDSYNAFGVDRVVKMIYENFSNINNIIISNSPNIEAVSAKFSKQLPLLDDFAQIVGASVRTVDMNASQILSALKKSSAVIIKNKGALCVGGTQGDAQAVAMVLEKNSFAYRTALLFGEVKPINYFESLLMRFVYLKKYSKKFNKK